MKPRIPVDIRRRAKMLIRLWRSGAIYAKRTYRRKYLSIRVNRKWRALSKDNGRHWDVMSHATYNNEI
ncbi:MULTISPECIES: hypothetical protein [Sodalis]|uniref:ParE family toxin-like protein n=1 Tax=Sodalis TaxID=84565 RepID=UPI0027FC1562|nr:hypothetical protein [Sodalis praecaptivus]CAJ0996739.1 hypothetical protein NVIRENTERO_02532 [Sodalis praecaptivus]